MGLPLQDHGNGQENSISSNHLQQIFNQQRVAFDAFPYPDASYRQNKLKQLKQQIIRYQDVIATAINQDFGMRSVDESKITDLMGSLLETSHAISHVKRWMKPSKRHTELLFMTNSLQVQYQPKGIVGVIVPWNFPVYLALGPLAAALAAGNRVMMKLSEFTPKTNAVVRKMLAEIFDENEVAVFGEEISNPSEFTSLPFNHIVFTGSPAVGHIVMRTAAENLTPVTLELGGKSPALVTQNYPIAEAAKRIIHGKTTNAGQICVSPDYALVPKQHVDEFVNACKANFQAMFGDNIQENTDYTSIINERHFQRIQSILADAKAKGAQIISCAEYDSTQTGRRVPVQLVLNCTADMRILQEELFGPVLPIIAYDSLDDALQYIKAHERPLALYCFSHDSSELDFILKNTHSGGVTVNDWGWHVVNHDAPFGGIGNSGMGTYHGVEGFRELSHAKTVLKRHRFFPTQLFYPPYGTWIQKLMIGYFLKKGDPNLKE
ncbi:coniferyl aldehyde dehydrogenase [Acinetobacter wuhouensis]|uniref:coniferyl aldehyde dehydrogenase n=1 Tax=Acinetobacter wuhouensis TaxID=1879050 RepID=UPI00083B4A8E|nr:coniferyl aldehyde dehydrogenase [Acinetobacter wuhouensis]AXQ22371.1 coniferyl aldehyde dehydrogenase [Acinetobacter wuhouensis]